MNLEKAIKLHVEWVNLMYEMGRIFVNTIITFDFLHNWDICKESRIFKTTLLCREHLTFSRTNKFLPFNVLKLQRLATAATPPASLCGT